MKIKISNAVLIFFLIFQCTLFAQETKTDSLQHQLSSLEGYERYDLLMQLTKQFLYQQPNQAFQFAKEACEVALEERKIEESMAAEEYTGIANIVMGNHDTALIIFSGLLINYEERGKEEKTGKIHNLLGVCYQDLSEHDLALNHYFASLTVNEKMSNKIGMANNYNNIGSMYYDLGNYQQALEYFNLALAIYEEKKPDGSPVGSIGDISRPVGNISVIYKEMQKYDSALIYAEKALALNKEAGNDYGVAGTLNNIGYIYDGMKEYSKAIEAYGQSLEINLKVNDKWSIANTNANIAKSYTELRQYDRAELFLVEALAIANEISAKDLLIRIYGAYADLNKRTGKYQKSLEYYTLMSEVKDSVFTEEKNRQVTEMQVKYETEKKEKENNALKKDNEIQTLKISRKNIVIYLMTGGIFIAIILLITIFYLFRKRTIAYKNLVVKNLELAHCDRKILESGEFIPEPMQQKRADLSDDDGELHKEIELIEKFNTYLSEEKPYLYSSIHIEDVSAQIGTNRTYLSKAINTVFSKSFNTLINELRIRAARQLMTDSKYAHISLEGIGQMVGYNSRTVFYNNFKKITGLTPSYFRESISND